MVIFGKNKILYTFLYHFLPFYLNLFSTFQLFAGVVNFAVFQFYSLYIVLKFGENRGFYIL